MPGEKKRKSFKLAKKPEQIGEMVHTIGFPGGNYAVIYGKVEVGDGKTFNRAGMRIQPGHSGGPLINKKGEIVGVALGVDVAINSNHSYFAGWNLIKTALDTSKKRLLGIPERGEVVIFTQSGENCPPCAKFHKEMKAELASLEAQGIKVTEVYWDGEKWDNPALKAEFTKATGKSGVGTPTIWLRGTKQTQAGYNSGSRLSVLGWIVRGFKNIGIALFGNSKDGGIDDSKVGPMPLLPLVPGIKEDGEVGLVTPVLTPEEEMEWENVTVVIILSKKELGYARGKLASVALNSIRGPLARANEEHLEGKAELILIPERTQPQRYEAFTSVAQIDPPLFYVVVLVKRQDLGLKGLIVGRIEKVIQDKLPAGTPVEVVFERVHANSYAGMTNALRVVEQGLEEPSESLKDSIVAAVKGEVLGVVTGKIDDLKGSIPTEDGIVGKVVANLGPAISENGKIHKTNGEEASLWDKILAGLVAVVLGGQGAGGIRGFLRERAMKKLGLEIEKGPKGAKK